GPLEAVVVAQRREREDPLVGAPLSMRRGLGALAGDLVDARLLRVVAADLEHPRVIKRKLLLACLDALRERLSVGRSGGGGGLARRGLLLRRGGWLRIVRRLLGCDLLRRLRAGARGPRGALDPEELVDRSLDLLGGGGDV